MSQPTPQLIAVASGKGGVGKSTVAHNLALILAHQGYRVGLIDADIYGASQSYLFGEQPEQCTITQKGMIQPVIRDKIAYVSISNMMPEDGPVLWRAPMATRLITDFLTRVEWPALDYLFIDLPPGTGDIQITLAQQAKLNGAIIVTTPQKLACQVAEKAIQMFQRVQVPVYGLIENMSGYVCGHCGETTDIFSHGGAQILADKYQLPVLSRVPLDPELIRLADQGLAIHNASSDQPTRLAFEAAAARLRSLVDEQLQQTEPTEMSIRDDNALYLQWADGTQKSLPAYSLRLLCPCASCIDENTGKPLLDIDSINPEIGIKRLHAVGRYGVRIGFSDHHDTGIFTYEALKKLDIAALSPELQKPQSTEPENTVELPSIETVQQVFDQFLNPQIASHGGHIAAIAIQEQKLLVKMSGGCQGCAQSKMTLQMGVKQLVQKHFPMLTEVVDTTEHSAGKNPYYSHQHS